MFLPHLKHNIVFSLLRMPTHLDVLPASCCGDEAPSIDYFDDAYYTQRLLRLFPGENVESRELSIFLNPDKVLQQ